MTKQERYKLRELALAATPGEWRVASDLPAYAIYAESGRRVVQTPNQNNRKQWGPSYDTHGIDRISDAAYIAAANPKTVLALLDRVDELESAEPVAWMWETPTNRGLTWVRCLPPDCDSHATSRPLYRHPPTERAVPEGWQPIETAPKDETPVLLRSKYGSHGDGYWLQSAKGGVGAWVWPYIHNEPWFWMPLPAAPQGGES